MLIQVTRRIFPSFFVKKKKVISYDKIVVKMKLKRKERKTRGKKKEVIVRTFSNECAESPCVYMFRRSARMDTNEETCIDSGVSVL